MKQTYEQPIISMILIGNEDVISTSGKGFSNPNSLSEPKNYSWDMELT